MLEKISTGKILMEQREWDASFYRDEASHNTVVVLGHDDSKLRLNLFNFVTPVPVNQMERYAVIYRELDEAHAIARECLPYLQSLRDSLTPAETDSPKDKLIYHALTALAARVLIQQLEFEEDS